MRSNWRAHPHRNPFATPVVGVEAELDRRNPPFDGAVAFIGADDGLWTRTVAWQQGQYAMTVAHFGVFEGSNQIIDEAARKQQDWLDEGGADNATVAELNKRNRELARRIQNRASGDIFA